jgi:hypothetical protein
VVGAASALPGSRVMEQPGPLLQKTVHGERYRLAAGLVESIGLAAILLLLVSRKCSLDHIFMCQVRERSDKVGGSYGKTE